MRRLLLLRHAKSAWADARLADHDRPLNRRGERAAAAMADHLVALLPRPELVLCSTALRTRQTLMPLVKRWAADAPPIALERELYLASERALLARLQTLPESARSVLLIGHNDGIWQLAHGLAGHGDAALRDSLAEKYPTGSLAILETDDRPWSDLTWGAARLAAFVRPRDLLPS